MGAGCGGGAEPGGCRRGGGGGGQREDRVPHGEQGWGLFTAKPQH